MALYKLIRDWGGFEKGQIIEVKSPDRLAAMNGDEVNPPAGVLYVEPKPAEEKLAESKPIVKKQLKSEKKGKK